MTSSVIKWAKRSNVYWDPCETDNSNPSNCNLEQREEEKKDDDEKSTQSINGASQLIDLSIDKPLYLAPIPNIPEIIEQQHLLASFAYIDMHKVGIDGGLGQSIMDNRLRCQCVNKNNVIHIDKDKGNYNYLLHNMDTSSRHSHSFRRRREHGWVVRIPPVPRPAY